MIHWLWLLLIVPIAFYVGFFAAALCGANKMSRLQGRLALEGAERRSLADTLRKKCLEVDKLKRLVKKMEKK